MLNNLLLFTLLHFNNETTKMLVKKILSSFFLRDDIFAFLLSTRAGGLGINLTAADTVC